MDDYLDDDGITSIELGLNVNMETFTPMILLVLNYDDGEFDNISLGSVTEARIFWKSLGLIISRGEQLEDSLKGISSVSDVENVVQKFTEQASAPYN